MTHLTKLFVQFEGMLGMRKVARVPAMVGINAGALHLLFIAVFMMEPPPPPPALASLSHPTRSSHTVSLMISLGTVLVAAVFTITVRLWSKPRRLDGGKKFLGAEQEELGDAYGSLSSKA